MKEAILSISLFFFVNSAAAQGVVDTPVNDSLTRYEILSTQCQWRAYKLRKSSMIIRQDSADIFEFIESRQRLSRHFDMQSATKDGLYLKLDTKSNMVLVRGYYKGNKKAGTWVILNPDSTVTLEMWRRGILKTSELLQVSY